MKPFICVLFVLKFAIVNKNATGIKCWNANLVNPVQTVAGLYEIDLGI
jgi:hypothetical protein